MKPTPHDFLLDLRGRDPALARRLDGIYGLAWMSPRLSVTVGAGSWSARELEQLEPRLAARMRAFFGFHAQLSLTTREAIPERLPFPALASKYWNHVGFWSFDASAAVLILVDKPSYERRWLPAAAAQSPAVLAQRAVADATAQVLRFGHDGRERLPGGPAPGPQDAVADLLDSCAAVAREHSSYTHLLCAFPGDPVADFLEGRLHAVKDWGTPRTPASLLHKYVGRLHYCDPRTPPAGLRIASALLEGCGTAR